MGQTPTKTVRHVGRVVDPAVDDDLEATSEPAATVASPERAATAADAEAKPPESAPKARPHPATPADAGVSQPESAPKAQPQPATAADAGAPAATAAPAAGGRLPPLPTPPPPPVEAPRGTAERGVLTPPPPSAAPATNAAAEAHAAPTENANRTQPPPRAAADTSTEVHAAPTENVNQEQPSVAAPEPATELPEVTGGATSEPPSRASSPPTESSQAPSASPAPLPRTGHPVRDRLLAKAAAAQATKERTNEPSGEELYPQFSSLKGVEDDLDELAAAPPRARIDSVSLAGSVLSPLQLSVFGTLVAVALLAAVFAFLIQFVPHADTPSLLTTTTPSSSVAAVAKPVASPTAQPPEAEAPAPKPRQRVPGPWRISEAKTGQKLLRGTIGRDPFLRAIQQAGLEKSQAYRVYTALKDETNLDRCHPKNEFLALVERSTGRVNAFEYIVSKEEVYQAKEGDDGLLKGERLDLKVERQRVQASLRIDSEQFADAAQRAGLAASIGRVIDKALDGHTRISQFRKGDRLRVVAQEVTVLGEFYRYAGIEALEYVPVGGDPLRIYYYSRKKRYYDAKGRSPGEGGWRSPVRGAPITSKFNPKRLHPILKKRMPHNGTDYGAPTGTPVRAASYGKITKRGEYGPNGNFIAIEHPGGYETGYSHLSRFEPGLKVGDQVARQQVIGYVGSTGRSTGPHLHFSAKRNGAFIDPESLNLDALVVLPSSERADFTKVKEHYDELLAAVPLPDPIAESEAVASAADVDEAPADEPEPARVAAAQAPASTPDTPAAQAPRDIPAKLAQARLPAEPAAAANAAAPPRQHTTLYLSDKELIELQAAVDDGEVAE